MIVPKTGLLKGGTFEFIAGFVDKDGNVLCPANVASPVNLPTVAGGVLPLVKCGEYKLKVRRKWTLSHSCALFGTYGCICSRHLLSRLLQLSVQLKPANKPAG
jgi:hypothetical protein